MKRESEGTEVEREGFGRTEAYGEPKEERWLKEGFGGTEGSGGKKILIFNF